MTRWAMSRTGLKRHSTDLVSLVAGVLFLGILGTWALERADLLAGVRGWILPVLLVAVGGYGLLGAPRRRNRDRATVS